MQIDQSYLENRSESRRRGRGKAVFPRAGKTASLPLALPIIAANLKRKIEIYAETFQRERKSG